MSDHLNLHHTYSVLHKLQDMCGYTWNSRRDALLRHAIADSILHTMIFEHVKVNLDISCLYKERPEECGIT